MNALVNTITTKKISLIDKDKSFFGTQLFEQGFYGDRPKEFSLQGFPC